MLVMFATLLWFGREIYHQAPPIPEQAVSTNGDTLFTRANIERGQNVWQSTGGMQQGSLWGHGGYLAPDWSADWLHREAQALLSAMAGPGADKLTPQQAAINAVVLREEMRRNTYETCTGTITVSTARARAIGEVAAHYRRLFQGRDAQALALRRAYAFPLHAVLSETESHDLTAFFFWAAWAATSNRPGQDITYTSNWPHEPLVGNTPTAGVLLWSLFSVVLLLAGIGALVWYYARQYDVWRADMAPSEGYASSDVMATLTLTPSMRATSKYFWVVGALIVVQVLLGIVTAHYGVEGQGLYGLPLVDYLPYAVTRTWHTQLAVLWIATAWLATGLYVAPLLSGHEPRYQRFGVNFLFMSLLIIVIGSFAGQWFAVHRHIPNLSINFWFGHQGYEYIDLGRFWQIYLFIGLLLWMTMMLRALWPAMQDQHSGSLVFLVVIATVSIGLLYGAGLMWGQHTHISIMEYWSGTPIAVLALGSVFSAMWCSPSACLPWRPSW